MSYKYPDNSDRVIMAILVFILVLVINIMLDVAFDLNRSVGAHIFGSVVGGISQYFLMGNNAYSKFFGNLLGFEEKKPYGHNKSYYGQSSDDDKYTIKLEDHEEQRRTS